jgi:hypothetical protein
MFDILGEGRKSPKSVGGIFKKDSQMVHPLYFEVLDNDRYR